MSESTALKLLEAHQEAEDKRWSTHESTHERELEVVDRRFGGVAKKLDEHEKRADEHESELDEITKTMNQIRGACRMLVVLVGLPASVCGFLVAINQIKEMLK